jgi:hypothetical protein
MSLPALATDPSPSEEDLQKEADRIERLLEDVRELAGRPAWQRVEELVQRLVRLYGTGLARLLRHLDQLGRLDEALATRLGDDALLSSLLLLHGLHPQPVEERVRRALEQAGDELASYVGPVTVVRVADDVVHLRIAGSAPVGATSALSVERLLARVLQDAAPEISHVELEGARRPNAGLVQIDLARGRGAAAAAKASAP